MQWLSAKEELFKLQKKITIDSTLIAPEQDTILILQRETNYSEEYQQSEQEHYLGVIDLEESEILEKQENFLI